jgi:heme O synthase-like polyprenyltransferase
MVQSEKRRQDVSIWIGRSLSGMLFLLLGAFFLEHLLPLLAGGAPAEGRGFLWLVQIIHLFLLLGYLISMRYALIGSLFIIVFGSIFFILTANGPSLWLFLFTSNSPVFFYAYGWLRKNRMDMDG